ncbi:hypothetical protein [Elizabethkingia meningoseptica]|uniref:hypothetical protein n=1 Tax=Elizabethkingia meningoseptica TaxID=238 RepID=UPI0023B199F6|nr:hypothetical protein [Elizabethkingia meningoseptica]MDE5493279.1 hypothetical protein [Elizabethkingia meningoseptica]
MSETKKQDLTLSNYIRLMDEIRKREEVIKGLRDGTSNAKYLIVNYEVIFFQLRKILEIIIKAPILINEEEYRSVSKTAEDDWRIRDIIKKLEKINPRFYPQSIEIKKTPNGIDEFVNREKGFLTKEELCEAYDHCNNYLHSHNPLKIESEVNFEEEWRWVVEIINKIHVLLDKHVCHPKNNGNFYFITMENGKGYPGGNLFKKAKETSANKGFAK